MGVIGKLYNHEFLIYIFTCEILNGTPNLFHKSHYNCWYKEMKNQFSPLIIDTKHKNFIFISIFWKIPTSGVIYQKTINQHDLCYQCSKDVPNFSFRNLIIRDCKDEPYFPKK